MPETITIDDDAVSTADENKIINEVRCPAPGARATARANRIGVQDLEKEASPLALPLSLT